MKALMYLTLRVLKNKLKESLRHPGRIIMYLIFFGVLFFNVFMTGGLGHERDINELYALAFGFFTVNFAFTVYEGFTSGGTLFALSDINLLFPSPLKPAILLLYGMINRLGASIVFVMAFLYEYPVLMDSYSLSIFDFAVILLFFALTVFASRIISMVIYFFSCGDERKKRIFKAVFVLMFALLALVIVREGELYKGLTLKGTVKGVTSPYVKLFPISGLILWATEGYLQGEALPVLVCFLTLALIVAVSFLILTKSKKSYYEDVVVTSSKSVSVIGVGTESASPTVRGKVKAGKTGLKGGKGASAIYFKHLKENIRSKRLLITSSTVISLIFVALSLATTNDALMIFAGNISIMSFTVLGARWYSELNKPYIYLIPESPVKKLLFSSLEQIPVFFTESLICLLPVFVVIGISPLSFICMILSRTSYGMLMLSASLITYRLLPFKKGGRLYVTVNSFIAMLFSAPSLVFLFMSEIMVYMSASAVFLLTIPVNFVIMMILFFASRNLFTSSEFKN